MKKVYDKNLCLCGHTKEKRSTNCFACSNKKRLGIKLSRETIEKMSGEKHHNWKGDKVKYVGLHSWVRNKLVKQSLCHDCRKQKPLDLANISQKYLRDLRDWEWLCRSCHMKKDGRLKILQERSKFFIKKITIPNDNKKFCLACHAPLIRKRFKTENRLECFASYQKRMFCNLTCFRSYETLLVGKGRQASVPRRVGSVAA